MLFYVSFNKFYQSVSFLSDGIVEDDGAWLTSRTLCIIFKINEIKISFGLTLRRRLDCSNGLILMLLMLLSGLDLRCKQVIVHVDAQIFTLSISVDHQLYRWNIVDRIVVWLLLLCLL